MPQVRLVMFRDEAGCPVLEWFRSLPTREGNKGLLRLERLALLGHELRRPEADYLEHAADAAARDKVRRIHRGLDVQAL